MLNLLILLLGCQNDNILYDRINTGINYLKNKNVNIDWFLSGGIKNSNHIIAESIKMKNILTQINNNWTFIIDNKATNTAENFIYFNNWYNQTNNYYDDVYIITSNYHHNRASRMWSLVSNINVKWILGNKKEENSEYMERIHMLNVKDDVLNAYNKIVL
jgi:hypothetical protein